MGAVATDGFKEDMLRELPRLRAYAAGLMGSISEADDLVQDALVRIWRFRDGFSPGTNLSAWMFQILRNEFFTQRRKPQLAMENIEANPARAVTSSPNQEWQLRYRELLEALPRLPAPNRHALLLVVAGGLSYEEAARSCGCDIGVLRGRVHRARAQLAELTDYEDQPRRARTNVATAHYV